MGWFEDSSEEKENQIDLIQSNIQQYQPVSTHDVILYIITAILLFLIISVILGLWCVVVKKRHSRLSKQIKELEVRVAKL